MVLYCILLSCGSFAVQIPVMKGKSVTGLYYRNLILFFKTETVFISFPLQVAKNHWLGYQSVIYLDMNSQVKFMYFDPRMIL